MFLQFRCPSCQKLFKSGQAEIGNFDVLFECPACQTTFSLVDEKYPNGQFKTLIYSQRGGGLMEKTFACPKCGHMNSKSESSCLKCEVILDRVSNISMSSENREFPSLETLWRKLGTDFDNESLHDEIFNQAKNLDALSWLLEKYQKVLSVQPGDNLAAKMQDRIKAPSQIDFENKFFIIAKTFWPLALGVLLLVLGLSNQGLRNLIGLGCGIIFLFFGYKILVPKTSR